MKNLLAFVFVLITSSVFANSDLFFIENKGDIRNENALNIQIVFRVTNVGANLVINVLAQENAIIVSQATPQVDPNRQLTAVGVFASRRI